MIFAILIALSVNGLAQESYGPKIDSLISQAGKARSDKADSLYMEVGHWLAYVKPVDAIPYLEKSLELADKYQHPKILCMSNSFLGIAYTRIGSYDKAVYHFNEQVNLGEKYKLIDEVAWGNNHIGNILLNLKNYTIANIYLQEAYEIADSLHNEFLRQFVLEKIGRYMLETGDFDSSIYYFNLVLESRLKYFSDSINLSETYRSLGNVYFNDIQYSEAKKYYGKSISLVDSLSSDIPAAIDVNLAHIYLSESKLDSALECAHRAVSCARRFNDRPVLSDAFGIMGNIYYGMENYAQAEKCFSTQISYQDSIMFSDVVNRIYDLQYQKQVYAQKQDLTATRQNTRFIIILSLVIVVLVLGAIFFALRLRRKRLTIEAMNIEIQNHNRLLNQSMQYARKIQRSTIPKLDNMGPYLSDKFMFFRPKQEVSGNFYWARFINGTLMLAVADSVESGVAGGFISMLGTNILYEITSTESDPAKVLSLMRKKALQVMRKLNFDSPVALGIDISFMVVDLEKSIISYSGVKFPLLIVRDQKLIQLQENLDSTNFYTVDFKTDTINMEYGDCFYVMTQGYCKQTNKEGEELGRERLFEYLQEIHELPMSKQKNLITEYLDWWKGAQEQDRDLLVLGARFQNINEGQ